MTTSRSGLSINEVEIDKQFSELKDLIDTKLGANPESGDPAQRAQATTLPQVTGIRTSNQIVGAISFEWNSVSITNLLYYDVQVSSLENFTNNSTKSYKVTGATSLILSDVSAGDARYVRVRVAAPNGFGPWSSSLNTQTGKATPNQLLAGAASNIVRHVQTAFDPQSLNTLTGVQFGEYGFIDIETIGGVVIVFTTLQYYVSYNIGFKLTVSLKEDGNSILTFDNYIESMGVTADCSLIQSLPGMAIPSTPPPGVHTYSWEIVIEDTQNWGSGFIFTPLNITTALVELRR